MLFTCGAWLLGHKIIVQLNNLNTHSTSYTSSPANEKLLINSKK